MIVAINPEQRDAALARRTPEVEEVGSGVWSIPLPLPSRGGVESTLCYGILDDSGGVTLIDPGWDTPDNRDRIVDWLGRVGRRVGDIRVLAATHFHPDHLGLAAALRDESGARLVLGAADAATVTHPLEPDDDAAFERWGVPGDERAELGSAAASRHGIDGFTADTGTDPIDVPGHPLVVIPTPGHTPGHLSFASPEDGLVFTGDHVLPIIHPGLGLGGPQDDPLGDYLASLDALAPYDDAQVCPGHGYRFTGLAVRRRELAEHHLRRNAEIGRIRDALDEPTVWTVAQRVAWTDGWDGLRGFLRRSALAQTEMHLRHLDRVAA